MDKNISTSQEIVNGNWKYKSNVVVQLTKIHSQMKCGDQYRLKSGNRICKTDGNNDMPYNYGQELYLYGHVSHDSSLVAFQCFLSNLADFIL